MKKVLLLVVFAITFTLAGCDQVEETVTDLQTKLTSATDTITSLESTLETANTAITELENSVTEAASALDTAEAQIAALEDEVNLTNAKIKNALSRDTWTKRKVTYNADWSPNNAEFCFGVFEDDWSTYASDDYAHNGGLKFVLTIESVEWGTEVFAKDSCGNYSNFLFDSSMYAFYSAPAGYFEEGATYEVVLYKDVYFVGSPAQLGFLPAADLTAQGQYPTDLTGIVSTKKED